MEPILFKGPRTVIWLQALMALTFLQWLAVAGTNARFTTDDGLSHFDGETCTPCCTAQEVTGQRRIAAREVQHDHLGGN